MQLRLGDDAPTVRAQVEGRADAGRGSSFVCDVLWHRPITEVPWQTG